MSMQNLLAQSESSTTYSLYISFIEENDTGFTSNSSSFRLINEMRTSKRIEMEISLFLKGKDW